MATLGPGAPSAILGEEERATGDGEPPLVTGGLEHRQCLLGELAESSRPFGPSASSTSSQVLALQTQAELGDTVAGRGRAIGRLGETRQHRSAALPGVEACPGQGDLEPSIA